MVALLLIPVGYQVLYVSHLVLILDLGISLFFILPIKR